MRATVFAVGITLVVGLLGAGAAAAPTPWPRCTAPTDWAGSERRQKLLVTVCGASRVVRGVEHNYTVLLTNVDKRSYRGLKLAVIHYDPIVRSSRPYRRGPQPLHYVMQEAIFTVGTLAPGKTFRLGIRLPFLQHNDPKGSNFMVYVRKRGSKTGAGITNDVWFVPR